MRSFRSHLVNYAMQQVMRSGTAAAAYQKLPAIWSWRGRPAQPMICVTWFASYTGNYLAVVWVGNDDNSSTGLSGATGALPVDRHDQPLRIPCPCSRSSPKTCSGPGQTGRQAIFSAEGCRAIFMSLPDRLATQNAYRLRRRQGEWGDPVNVVNRGTVNKILDLFR